MCSIDLIHRLKREFKLPIDVCEKCAGDGEIVTFCGHEVTEYCHTCEGKGYKRNDTKNS